MRSRYRIAVIPGDGTGPEVVNEGRKVLKVVAAKYGFHLESAIWWLISFKRESL